jgi:hypothetical protein
MSLNTHLTENSSVQRNQIVRRDELALCFHIGSPWLRTLGLLRLRAKSCYSNAFGCVCRIRLDGMLTMSAPHYPGYPRPSPCLSSLRTVVMTLRRTSKITAVDQPNNRTPFIAVMGPSKFQRSPGVTSP